MASSSGLLENVKDGQTIYLLPDSSKNPVLAFTVRKSAKKSDYASDISNPAKWSDDFRGAVSQRGTILVKNHVDQTKWHITTVVGYYDEEWFLENGHDRLDLVREVDHPQGSRERIFRIRTRFLRAQQSPPGPRGRKTDR